MLTLVCLNCILKVAHAEISHDCWAKKYDQHLTWETAESSQLMMTQCSSRDKFEIQCSCIDDDSASQLKSLSDVNLIMMSAALIPNWLQKTYTHLNSDNKLKKWEVRHVYDDVKMNKLVKKLFIENQSLLKLVTISEKSDIFQYTIEQTHIIIITTRESYADYVHNVMKEMYQSSKTISRTIRMSKLINRYWKIVWNRVTTDEIHFKMTVNSEIIHLFKNFDTEIQKWFLTDISFEWSSAQMMAWVSTIKNITWLKSKLFFIWSEKELHCVNLKFCMMQWLHQMKKTHNRIVDNKETDFININTHIKTLTDVLKTLWLKHNTTQSTFFDNSLINVIVNTHYIINCSLLLRFNELVNTSLAFIKIKLEQNYAMTMMKWIADDHLRQQSIINVNVWMMQVQQLQILSIFLWLRKLVITKSLIFLNTKNWENNWVHIKQENLYELEKCDFSYEKHIMNICSEDYCSKIAVINNLI